jgi:hypothetical protein
MSFTSSSSGRLDRVILLSTVIVLSVAALVVRLAYVNSPVLKPDEAFSWRLTQYRLNEIVRRSAEDVHPPLYYIVLKFWCRLVGDGVVALRLPSIICGLSAVLLAYRLAVLICETPEEDRSCYQPGSRQHSCWMVGFLASLCVALSEVQIDASVTARMYALGALLALGSTVVAVKASKEQSLPARRLATLSVVNASLLYTHNYGVFIVVAQYALLLVQSVYLWEKRKTCLKFPSSVLASASICLLLYFPWLPSLLWQTGTVMGGYWIGPITMDRVLGLWCTTFVGTAELPPLLIGLVAAASTIGVTYGLILSNSGYRLVLGEALTSFVGGVALSAWAGELLVLNRSLTFASVLGIVCLAACVKARLGKGARYLIVSLLLACSFVVFCRVRRAREDSLCLARVSEIRTLKLGSRGSGPHR